MLQTFFHVFLVLLFLSHRLCLGDQKVLLMECQHAKVVDYDRRYFRDLHFFSKRYKRDNKVYFLTMSTKILKNIDNSFQTHFYVYELLSNVYKRSFIEIHANFCDFMNQDTLFSRAVKSTDYKALTQCPVPPGDYILANMTAPYGPFLKTFPFKQGRLYANLTTKSNKVIGSIYTDIKITELNAKDFYKYIKL